MKIRNTLITGICASVGMLFLILDSRTALNGAMEGISLCVRTVIPSLFPFFVLSVLLTSVLSGSAIPCISLIGKHCGIPKGAESILLVGLLGGYPVGAQCVAQAFASGQISRTDARRMLGFCSNAGPAFIFGVVGSLFSSLKTTFLLWLIHILSALTVGILLPGHSSASASIPTGKGMDLSDAMNRSIRILAVVCGWVILFRIILAFLQRWFLWLLPQEGQILISGILELTNGCIGLALLPEEGLRFILASAFLSFGGVCVGMQTVSVLRQAGLDAGFYFPGKLLQMCVSLFLSAMAVFLLFPDSLNVTIATPLLTITACAGMAAVLYLRNRKNNSSIPAEAGV